MPTITTPKNTGEGAKGSKARAAAKSVEGKELTAGEVATLEQWTALEKARHADPTVPIDVELVKAVKAIKPGYAFKPDEIKALTESERGAKASTSAKGGTRGKSALAAAVEVLKASDGPLSVKDLLAKIAEGKLYEFTDAPTPPSTRLFVQLHAGIKKGITVKVGKGIFDLAELNPKGAAKRPAPKA